MYVCTYAACWVERRVVIGNANLSLIKCFLSPQSTILRRYFYSIKDISIGGHCVCFGHANECVFDKHVQVFPQCWKYVTHLTLLNNCKRVSSFPLFDNEIVKFSSSCWLYFDSSFVDDTKNYWFRLNIIIHRVRFVIVNITLAARSVTCKCFVYHEIYFCVSSQNTKNFEIILSCIWYFLFKFVCGVIFVFKVVVPFSTTNPGGRGILRQGRHARLVSVMAKRTLVFLTRS